MRCESVQSALVDGRPLSAADDKHLPDCAACARLVATLGVWQAAPLRERDELAAPSVTALRRGVRGQRLREFGLAAATILLIGLALPQLRTQEQPALLAIGTLSGTTSDEGVEAVASEAALVATELIAAARPETGADEALLLAMVSLDRMDAPAEGLPDTDLLTLLDPYDTDPDPLITLGDL